MFHVQPIAGALAKRMGTLVLFAAGDGSLLRGALIFRGTGTRISATEREAWHKDVTVLWQKKAWMDSPTMMRYPIHFDTPIIPTIARSLDHQCH
jgi:hypothetical protein